MKRRHSIEETFELDKTIQKLALYEICEGKMVVPTDRQGLIDFELECADKFNYFKDLIQKGECDLEYLENTVLSKNGAYNQNEEFIGTPEELIEELEMEDKRKLEETKLINLLQTEIGSLFGRNQDVVELGELGEVIVIGKEPETTTTTTTPKKKKAKKK